MKAPFLLVACALPESHFARVEFSAPFRRHGYVAEAVSRWVVGDYLREACGSMSLRQVEAPDAVVIAAEQESVPLNVGGSWMDAWDVVETVRELPDDALLPGRVRAKTVPLVLCSYGRGVMFYAPAYRRHPRRVRWFREVTDPRRLLTAVEECILEWRRSLLDELDLVGYAITRDERGEYRVGRALLHPPRDGDMVAADVSPEGLARAHWYVLPSDVLERDLPGLAEFEDLLNTYEERARLLRKKPETIFQEFFSNAVHAHMLYEGLYDHNHPKVTLPDPVRPRRHYQPDLIQRPRPLSAAKGGRVLDFKLPDVKLLTRTAFHPGFTADLWRAVQQLRDYRERIDSGAPAVVLELQRQLGWIPAKPSQAVVIGLRDREDPEVLQHREETLLRDLDVRLITYDDVLNREVQRIVLQHRLSAG